MPRLLRGVVRTAAIAGTATAVSNRVSRRQSRRWANQQPEPSYEETQSYAAPAPPPPPAPVDHLAALTQLGELKAQGVLTEAEFAQEKARILAS